jgi:hypothetical protein
VVSRGNSRQFFPNTDPTVINYIYPQSFPDNWIISIGASGYDGNTVQNGLNQSYAEEQAGYWSLYGGNMDLIAPGSDSIVYTTNVVYEIPQANPYTKFNGTSAAAPHVSGVVALLLSHYNKNCYSNRNLSVEDVEYILEHSATNLYGPGYDDTTGWGRLDAYKALQMIENPTKQIIHPDSLINSIEVARDTIALAYNEAFVPDNWGPISSSFPLATKREYQVVRYLIQNTYSFEQYYSSTTDILGYWARPSCSNGLRNYNDTTQFIAAGTPAGTIYTYTDFDYFDNEPFIEIIEIDSVNKTVITRGYFYHFINSYLNLNLNNSGTTNEDVIINPTESINIWYPINPFLDTVKLTVSMYLYDSTWQEPTDFPCIADNPLYDENFQLGNVELENYKIEIRVYPNPGNSSIKIVNDKNQQLGTVEITDLTGKLILKFFESESESKVDISNLNSGIYLIKCNDDKFLKTIKFIKI